MTHFRIRSLREARGVSRYEIAEAAGVSYAAVAQWEDGKVLPTADKLPAIAAVLGCEVGELYEPGELRAAGKTMGGG